MSSEFPQQNQGLGNVIDTEVDPSSLGRKGSVRTPEEAMEVFQSLVAYLKENNRLLTTFAEDTSLQLQIPGRHGSFAIDMDSGKIHVPVEWFMERSYTKNQVLWACLHEVAHFRELMDDLPGEKHNRLHILKKAKEIAPILQQKVDDALGGDYSELVEESKKQKEMPIIPGHTISMVENHVFGYYHTFQNIVRDVFVNNYVARKAPVYDKSMPGGENVSDLYKEVLFPGTNYASKKRKMKLPDGSEAEYDEPLPRHLQFVYKMMREEMVPGEEVTVSDEVAEVFSRKIKYKGRRYSIKEVLDNFMKPRTGRDTKLSTRTEVAYKTLEPIFDELLRKDLEEMVIRNPKNKGNGSGSGNGKGEEDDQQSSEKPADGKTADEKPTEGSPSDAPPSENAPQSEQKQDSQSSSQAGPKSEPQSESAQESAPTSEELPSTNPFQEFYDDFGKNEIDQFKPDEIDEFVKKQEEKKEEERKKKEAEEEEKRKSAEQKRKEEQERLDKQFCQEKGISEEVMKGFRQIQEEVAPYIKELSLLWDHIIYGSTKEIRFEMDGHYQTGVNLDVRQVIKEFPNLKKEEGVRVYEKMVERSVPVEKPELIRVRLVGDTSGSMQGHKIELLKRLEVMLLSSLAEFNDRLRSLRNQTNSKTWADTEVWKFADVGECVKPLAGGPTASDEVDIIKSYSKIWAFGGTNNTDVLEKISASIDESESAKMRSGKIMDILIEVTDGVPNNYYTTHAAMLELEGKGQIVRAFLIAASEAEKDVFNTIWNSDGKQRGFIINDTSKLIAGVADSLKEYMSNVRL